MTGTLMVGVSGVRGIVDRDLTPDVVRRYAMAFGTWVREGPKDGGRRTGPHDRPSLSAAIPASRGPASRKR